MWKIIAKSLIDGINVTVRFQGWLRGLAYFLHIYCFFLAGPFESMQTIHLTALA
jgi:hypothetical protein